MDEITKEQSKSLADIARAGFNEIAEQKYPKVDAWESAAQAVATHVRAESAEDLKVLRALKEALDSRDLFSNPEFLHQIAIEIDCDRSCNFAWHEWDTNASGCRKSERGEYCPNDLADTLRAVADVARSLNKEAQP